MIDNITVFDFETSGLSPMNDRVIEMAALRIRGGKVVGEFSTLVKIDRPLPAKITEITGLTDADVELGIDDVTAFKILNRFIGDSILVAHNATFDLAFLHYNLMRLANRTFDNPFIDTLTISRDRYTYPHKLENMCQRLGIGLTGAHRALNDVYGCYELLKALHAEESVEQWVNKLGYLRKYGAPDWTPDYATVFATDNRYEPRTAG